MHQIWGLLRSFVKHLTWNYWSLNVYSNSEQEEYNKHYSLSRADDFKQTFLQTKSIKKVYFLLLNIHIDLPPWNVKGFKQHNLPFITLSHVYINKDIIRDNSISHMDRTETGQTKNINQTIAYTDLKFNKLSYKSSPLLWCTKSVI